MSVGGLDDDITNGPLSSDLFLGRFSGFNDFSFVFVHVKNKRCLPAFFIYSFKVSMLLSNL